MVNSISGVLTFKEAGTAGVETGGIEWAIDTSSTTLAGLPPIGSQVRLYTHLHHVQDSMRLYGFGTIVERRLFLALVSVNGVGPSLARKILSGTSPERFLTAMEQEDLDTLSSIPGLGKKTAQKIVLQLRGKLTDEQPSSNGAIGKEKDMVEALAAMGFDARGAGKAVSAILEEDGIAELTGEEREREILRRAIIALSS